MRRVIPIIGVVISAWSVATLVRAGASGAALSAALLLALFALLIMYPSWKVMPPLARVAAVTLLLGAAAMSFAPALLG